MNRKQTLIAGTAAVLLMLGGCHKKVGGQVVATVNDDEITQQELNLELQGVSLPASADKEVKQKVMAQVLQHLVDRQLLVQQAKADGLDKQPEYLSQLLKLQDELLIKLLAAKLSKNIALPDGAAVDKFIADSPSMFAARKHYVLDQLAFPAPKDASVIPALQPAHSLDAIAAVLSAHGVKFVRGKGQLDSAMMPPVAAQHIAELPAGEPFIVPQGGQFIANVITSSTAAPTPDAQARPTALNLLRQKALDDALQARLKQAKTAAKIQSQQGLTPPAK